MADSYLNTRELREMAVGNKIKCYMKLRKKEPVKGLHLDPTLVCKLTNVKKVIIKNSGSGEITHCKSMYQFS